MSAAEQALRLQRAGNDLTVESLGGYDAVTEALAGESGPAALLLVGALLAEWESAHAAAATDALCSSLAAQRDPLAYEDFWNILFGEPDVLRSIMARVAEEPLRRLEHRTGDREAGLASLALDVLCRLSITMGAPAWKLYGALEDLTADAPTHLLISVARHVGLIYVHDDSRHARELVRRVLGRLLGHQEVAADAVFQLANADLVDALAAASRDEVEELLRSSRAGFNQALSIDSGRVDAELYALALDAVLGLVDRRPHGELRTCAERIHALGFLRRAWNTSGRTEWFGDPLAADREWWALSQSLARAADVLADDVWLEPMYVLEHVGRALRAVATANLSLREGTTQALSLVIVPVLRAPFVADSTKRALVRKWVAQLKGEDRSIGDLLESVVEGVDPKDGADPLKTELVRLIGEDVVNELSPTGRLALLRRLDARMNLLNTEKPQVRRAFEAATRQLHDNLDYEGDVRACFDHVLLSTLRFLADRMNIQLADPRVGYLKNPDAKEAALQEDYRQWVVGNGLQGITNVEVSDIAAGRVDVRFAFDTHVLVTEVKRDEDPFREGALARYLNQAGAYQASDVRLGILLVLDLSDKTRGQTRSLENAVLVTTKPAVANGDLPRHIVVVVVPGNRQLRPSELRS